MVRELHRDERGGVGDGVGHGRGVESAERVDAHDDHVEGLAGAGVQDAGMLDRGRDDAVGGLGSAHRPVDRGVHRLGAARGEHDLARAGAEEGRHLLAGLLDRDARDAPVGVHPAGIGVVVPQEGEHRLQRAGAQWRRRRVWSR